MPASNVERGKYVEIKFYKISLLFFPRNLSLDIVRASKKRDPVARIICEHALVASLPSTAGARQPKFRPLFDELVGSKRANSSVWRLHVPRVLSPLSFKARVRGYNIGLSVTTGKSRAYSRERTRVSTRHDTRRRPVVSLSFHGTPRRVDPTCQSGRHPRWENRMRTRLSSGFFPDPAHYYLHCVPK